MGTAAHAVLEAAYRGVFNGAADPKQAALAMWDELLAEVAQSAEESPRPERWRDYQMRRLRTAARAAAVVPSGAPTSAGAPAMRIEKWLVSRDGKVRGRPDRIESRGGRTTIVDLKTSALDPGEVPIAYRQQLQLYAWLWHEATSSWPNGAAIEVLDGTRHSIEVDPDECESLAADAIVALDSFNALVSASADFLELASPGSEQCRYCRYRGGCPAFLSSAEESWRRFRATVGGKVVRGEPDGHHESPPLKIAAEWGTTRNDGGIVSIRGQIEGPEVGEEWAVADGVVPEVALHDYWADADSLIWFWDSSPVD